MGFLDDGERDAEIEDLEVAHFLGERDDLGQEIDSKAKRVTTTADTSPLCLHGEDAARDAHIALLELATPVFENLSEC